MSFLHSYKKTLYNITFISSLLYILYRTFFTLPTSGEKYSITSLIFSIIILLIEYWEFFDYFVYYYNILLSSHESPKIPSMNIIKNYPDIDILIATYNEEEEILLNTINHCKKISYPDKSKIHIYLCDDGHRDYIKKMCLDNGINYICRNDNIDAKAGNYNNALKIIKSPFIAVFDADMAPTENFLITTLPFFYYHENENLDNKNLKKNKNNNNNNNNNNSNNNNNEINEKIGFIQLPQSFINPDIYQYRFNLINELPFEQDYFYHIIQIAKNTSNSIIFCGTNTLFSRKSLDSINGFAKGTITEDFATGMLIQSKGYKCIALNKIEAYGNNTNNLNDFIKQRSRWARGCIQIFKKYNILFLKGLNLKQKIDYLSCISYWFFSIRRFINYMTPLIFCLFNIYTADCKFFTYLYLFLPQYLLKRFLIDYLDNFKHSSTWMKIYETILMPILSIEVLKEFFGFGNTKFEVTPKISNKEIYMSWTNKKLLFMHLGLFILNIFGLAKCLYEINVDDYDNLVYFDSPYYISLFGIISNLFYLSIAIIFDCNYDECDFKKFVPNKNMVFNKKSVWKIFTGVD